MYEWQDTLRNDIDRLIIDDSQNQYVINLYGSPLGKTYFSMLYKDNPSVVCIHVDETAEDIRIDNIPNKIILLISLDILDDIRVDFYFNVEENMLLSRLISS